MTANKPTEELPPFDELFDFNAEVSEEELKIIKEQLISYISGQIRIGIAIYQLIDGELILKNINKQAKIITGLESSEMLSKPITEIFPGISNDLHNNFKKVASAGGSINKYELHYKDDRINGIYEISVCRISQNKLMVLFADHTQKMVSDEKMSLTQYSVDHSSVATFVINLKGQIVYANNKACNNLGYTFKEITSRNVFDIDPRINTESWKELIEKLKKTDVQKLNSIQKRKNGSTFPTSLTSNYFKYKKNEYILAYVEDITDHLNAERALRSSEEKYRTIFEHFVDLYYQTDMNGVLTTLSPSTLELSGYTPEELIGRPVTDVYDNPKDRFELMRLLKERGKVEDYELKLIRKDGNVRDVSINSAIRFNEKGIPISIEGVIRDHTERKRQELIIKKSLEQQKLLSEVSFKLNSLTDVQHNIDNALELTGKHTEVSRVYIFEDNRTRSETSNTFEWCDEQTEPQIDELQNISYNTLPSLNNLMEERKALISSDISKLPSDLYDILQPQDIKSIIIFPVIVSDERFGFIGFDDCKNHREWDDSEIELLKTISNLFGNFFERKLTEEKLIVEKERAEESDKLKSAFLTTMSHELRTPLNAIIGFSELIDKDCETEELNTYTQSINISGKHLLNIIEDVFEITSLETGTVKVEITEFELGRLANELKDIFILEQHKLEKELKYIFRPDHNNLNPKLTSDRSKLKSLLANLVKNAVKFTDSGSVTLSYSISESEGITFSVKDTGIGIDKKYRDLIFERFRQVDDTHTREYGGTGLGLTIVKRIADLLEGKLWFESAPGDGTEFFFRLPPDKVHFKKSKAEKRTEKPEKGNMVGLKILIVEDEQSNYLFLKTVLKRIKIETLHAENGKVAIDLVKKTSDIDLVLMDIKMPEMNGYEATTIIKSIKPDLPVIAQTAYALPGDREKAINAGCDGYLEKPIDRLTLIGLIKEFSGK